MSEIVKIVCLFIGDKFIYIVVFVIFGEVIWVKFFEEEFKSLTVRTEFSSIGGYSDCFEWIWKSFHVYIYIRKNLI